MHCEYNDYYNDDNGGDDNDDNDNDDDDNDDKGDRKVQEHWQKAIYEQSQHRWLR